MKYKEPTAVERLIMAGIRPDVAHSLRRIAMTLNRWHELECGTDAGHIEQNEATGKWPHHRWIGQREYVSPVPDREKGAKSRLANLMSELSEWIAYEQGDCRGAALYMLRKADVSEWEHKGQSIDQVYSRGIAVY